MSKIIADLKRDEGFVDHAYQDSEGYWTIGYGSLIDNRLGATIPEPVAAFWLNYKLNEILTELFEHLPWARNLPEPAKRGLSNMAYNLGWSRLSKFKKMLAALEQHDFEKAAKEALDSKWARQVHGRADRIADLYRSCIDAE